MKTNSGGIYDLTGRGRNEPIRVVLRPGVGIQHNSEHHEGGPHSFPPKLAMELLHSNRATLYEGDEADVDLGAEHGDPSPEHGDPTPNRRRGR